MENINIKKQSKKTASHLSAYAHNQWEISKLIFIKKTAQTSSFIMYVFIFSLFALFISFALSIALGLYIGEAIGSYPLAFVIIAGINLLLLLLVFAFKNVIIYNPILRKLIKEI